MHRLINRVPYRRFGIGDGLITDSAVRCTGSNQLQGKRQADYKTEVTEQGVFPVIRLRPRSVSVANIGDNKQCRVMFQ